MLMARCHWRAGAAPRGSSAACRCVWLSARCLCTESSVPGSVTATCERHRETQAFSVKDWKRSFFMLYGIFNMKYLKNRKCKSPEMLLLNLTLKDRLVILQVIIHLPAFSPIWLKLRSQHLCILCLGELSQIIVPAYKTQPSTYWKPRKTHEIRDMQALT